MNYVVQACSITLRVQIDSEILTQLTNSQFCEMLTQGCFVCLSACTVLMFHGYVECFFYLTQESNFNLAPKIVNDLATRKKFFIISRPASKHVRNITKFCPTSCYSKDVKCLHHKRVAPSKLLDHQGFTTGGSVRG